MERRLSVRRSIDHDATIKVGNGPEYPCVISDFCEMGILVTLSDDVSMSLNVERKEAPNLNCQVSFLTDAQSLHRLLVRVVHHTGNNAGIQFKSAEKTTFSALDAIHRNATAKIKSRSDQERIVKQCAAIVLHHVNPLLEESLTRIHERSNEQALNADNDKLANAFIDFSKRLDRVEQSLLSTLRDALKQPIEFLQDDFDRHNRVSQELTVVGKDEFEDWLKARVIITRAETRYYSELLPLKMRLDAIGLATENRKLSPFGPELIVLAFRHAVTGLANHPKVEKMMFEVFEQTVMTELDNLYETLNKALIENGVLPNLDVAKTRKAKEENRQKARETTQEKLEQVDTENPQKPETPKQQKLPGHDRVSDFEAVQREYTELTPAPTRNYGAGPFSARSSTKKTNEHMKLDAANDLGVEKQFEGQADNSFKRVHDLLLSLKKSSQTLESELARIVDQPEKFTRSELDQGIALMQQAISPEMLLDDSSPALLKRLLDNLAEEGEQPAKGLKEEQQVTIDVVDRFFNSMKQNPNLSSKAKEHIVSLEGPVLHSMLNEENVLGEANHIIHQILNKIGQLGSLGIRLSTKNQSRVDSLIHDLRHNFQDDRSIAETVLDELSALVSKHKQSYNKNIDRVAAAAEGALKVSEAKSAVAEALNDRFAGQEIPKAVSTLIQNGWRDLLNLVYIKEGPNSASWQEHLDVIDNLLEYSRNPNHPLDMKDLLSKIQAGLSSVSQSNTPPALVREDLKKLITDAPNRKHELVQSTPEVGVEIDPEEEKLTKNEKLFKLLKPWIIRARACTVGSWMRFDKPGKEPQYIRLVWVAKHFSKFVFVNHQGRKVIELGLFKFSSYLKDGTVTPDPDYSVPIINQGLDSMIKDVYEDIAEESRIDTHSRIPTASAFKDQIRSVMTAHDQNKNCQLIYLRANMDIEGRPTSLTPASKKQMGELLMEVCSLETVAGHLNESDFALFSVASNPLGESSPEDLSMFIDVPKECSFTIQASAVETIYHSTQLDRLIAEAASKLSATPESSLEDEFITIKDSKILAEERAKVSVKEELSAPPIEDEEILVEDVLDFEIDEAELLKQSDQDAALFDVYYQASQSIKEDYSHIRMAELIPSKPGSGLAFEPSNQDESIRLDKWWISHLVTRYNDGVHPWDHFEEVRIRLSAYSLNHDEMVELLINCATQAMIPADKLWFDIFDSYVFEDVNVVADRISTLSEYGYRFCLDQFGSPNAPFSLLKGLPVHMIKVDEKYIANLNKTDAEQDEDQADSIIEVAQYLGKKVLSGSVDTAICLQRMKKLDVDFVQGAHIGRYTLLELADRDQA